MVRQAEDGPSGQAAAHAPRRLRAQRHHGQAAFQDALVEGEEGGQERAPQRARDLPSDEGPRLPVRPPHLPEVRGHVAALDRLAQDQVVQAPVVEDGDSRARARRAVHEGVRGRVAEMVQVEVGLGPFRRRPHGHGGAQGGIDGRGILDHGLEVDEAGERREGLRHVVGDAGRRGRQR